MKYFLVSFLFISHAFSASDCTSKLGNLSIAVKMRAVLADQMYGDNGPFRDKKATPDEVCAGALEKVDMKDVQDQRKKIIKIIKNDLKTKKKTNGSFFSDLADNDTPDFMTEADICKAFDKNLNNVISNHELDAKIAQKYAIEDFLNLPIQESCKKMVGEVRDFYDKRMAEANKEPVREPPGEEISPADEPAPKSLFSEKGIKQPTESTGRAKVKSYSGTGASSQ